MDLPIFCILETNPFFVKLITQYLVSGSTYPLRIKCLLFTVKII